MQQTYSLRAADTNFQPLYDYINVGEPNKAVISAKRLLDSGHRNPDLISGSGMAGTLTEQFEMAIDCLVMLLNSGMGNQNDQLFLAQSQEKIGEFQAALNCYDKILLKDDSITSALLGRSNCLANLDRPIESIEASKIVLDAGFTMSSHCGISQ